MLYFISVLSFILCQRKTSQKIWIIDIFREKLVTWLTFGLFGLFGSLCRHFWSNWVMNRYIKNNQRLGYCVKIVLNTLTTSLFIRVHFVTWVHIFATSTVRCRTRLVRKRRKKSKFNAIPHREHEPLTSKSKDWQARNQDNTYRVERHDYPRTGFFSELAL